MLGNFRRLFIHLKYIQVLVEQSTEVRVLSSALSLFSESYVDRPKNSGDVLFKRVTPSDALIQANFPKLSSLWANRTKPLWYNQSGYPMKKRPIWPKIRIRHNPGGSAGYVVDLEKFDSENARHKSGNPPVVSSSSYCEETGGW